jgi:hypothetical protein
MSLPTTFGLLSTFGLSYPFGLPSIFTLPSQFTLPSAFGQGQSNKWYRASLPSPCFLKSDLSPSLCRYPRTADRSTYQLSPLCFSICTFIDAPALGHFCNFELGYSLLGLTKRGGAPLPAPPSTALSFLFVCRFVFILERVGSQVLAELGRQN